MAVELPVVTEKGQIVVSGEVVSTYALWEDINQAIRPILSEHGFALSFRCGQEAEAVVVTAVLSHRDGHREETSLRLPPDPGPSRNGVQAIGSSVSYGKRYTACALLNITSRGEDDDGRAAGGLITLAQMQELEDQIIAVKASRKRLLRYLKLESIELIPTSRFEEAKAALKAKAETAGAVQ